MKTYSISDIKAAKQISIDGLLDMLIQVRGDCECYDHHEDDCLFYRIRDLSQCSDIFGIAADLACGAFNEMVEKHVELEKYKDEFSRLCNDYDYFIDPAEITHETEQASRNVMTDVAVLVISELIKLIHESDYMKS